MIVNLDLMLMAAIVMFIVLAAIIYRAISEIPLFAKPVAFFVAVCMALLCLIAMTDFIAVKAAEHQSQTASHIIDIRLDCILLPYASLALAIIFLPLVLLFIRIHKMIETKRKLRQVKREMRR